MQMLRVHQWGVIESNMLQTRRNYEDIGLSAIPQTERCGAIMAHIVMFFWVKPLLLQNFGPSLCEADKNVV